ncbi:DUF2000 domain-containing protein [Cronobacter dublinensis]|nr:DUF2000 domain-containing protein [Cronobacter dublinensis]EKF2292425.1 DUF2000 domain-containing protein [Cronobacter dublinensis]EKF2294932.1 DUF2000 domain-containing protein [Cronobacter dublinensis]EKK5269264.1 DUF2000 domain-containing protein [Cronobacter dublinensis]EKM0135748.1 DUF2000 domain-containing protein [Cronobacter dublinensis]
MFEDNQKKLYIIVNRNMDASVLMNATGHLAAGIMQKAEEGVFHDYPNDATGLTAYLSHYPVVILQAKNSNQLHSAILKCKDAGLVYNFFTSTMLGQSTEQQIEATKNAAPEALEFIAIAVFGDTDVMQPITKKFSVYK